MRRAYYDPSADVPLSREEYEAHLVDETRAAIEADTTLSPDERAALLRWCDEGCPGDEPDDAFHTDEDY